MTGADADLCDDGDTLLSLLERPLYLNLNRLIAQVISSLIASLCFTGINTQPPCEILDGDIAKAKRACVMVASNTAIADTLSCIDHEVDLMYAKHVSSIGMSEKVWRR